ncbi:carboxylesterase/lipase family protein [Williamsia sterculiae]|uniref:Para-nitrobenzyl esterase n=1 Tax=Williamsia sterculiae TaxID=1344003 RepID=A0A1N7HA16_9NOCA|nr:carboxylesterase family protein [Williamsia sterculiae]SIS21623.1 para-nitrobenzyl esterase [Williamsia sterculiae]
MKRILAATVAATLATAGAVACDDSSSPHTADAPTTVVTSSGTLHGKTAGGTRQFTGVRYAKPPVGDLRWTLPQPPPDTTADTDATGPGTPCQQSGKGALSGALTAPGEDCLFLNVTTPRRSTQNTKLPVMVWWHGGGYTSGSGIAYDPQRLADTGNVAVVTVNYRLGVFGYLGLPGLAGSGDFGFADQLESLRWVKKNAAAFGADPDNVTVFGESAGGMSTCAALTSPAARGLIDKVAISSGSCYLRFPTGAFYPGVPEQTPYASLADNLTTGTDAARTLGCAGPNALRCLRALPADRLLTVNQDFTNDLAYGTDLLPHNPADAVRDGQTLRVPVISGGNHNEHRAFTGGVVLADPKAITATSYPGLLAAAFGDRAADVARRYPLDRYASAPLAWATVITDSGWSCATARANRALAAHGPVYGYEFADETAPNVGGIDTPLVPQGATHASDLPYLFDIAGKNLVPTPPRSDLSQRMIEYWTSFAHTGTPRATNGPDWPRTDTDTRNALTFTASSIAMGDQSTDHQCDFWDTVTSP